MLSEKQPINVEELLAKAKKPSADAMRLHPFYRGKIETTLKCAVRSFNDFAIWYTPGVAAPCRAIADDPGHALILGLWSVATRRHADLIDVARRNTLTDTIGLLTLAGLLFALLVVAWAVVLVRTARGVCSGRLLLAPVR